jgi:DNA sulfur modification protein DndE
MRRARDCFGDSCSYRLTAFVIGSQYSSGPLRRIDPRFRNGDIMKRMCKAICTVVVTLAMVPGLRANGQTLEDRADSQLLENLDRTSPLIVAEGVRSYIYGYPLLMFGVTSRTATNVPDAVTKLAAAPLNQFGKELVLPNASFDAVVLPSTSTLYASSFLDLCKEPVILHIPNMNGRFFILQMLDGWTEVSTQSPGSRLQSQEGDYALVGPRCNGHDQPPITGSFQDTIRMPTSSMWIIGRIYTNGSQSDIDDITNNIYPGLTLTPWSKYKPGQQYTPPDDLGVQPIADVITTPLRQVSGMDACAFFQNLAAMLNYNPPIAGQDDALVRSLERVGITNLGSPDLPKAFDCTMLRADKLASLQQSVALAKRILNSVPATRPTSTGWTVSLDVGTYGRRYLLRAEVAQDALGANRAEDAVYGYTQTDGNGNNLSGRRNYVIHFAKPGVNQGIPPVNKGGFWSLTIYDSDGKLVPWPVNGDSNGWNAVGDPYVQNHKPCFNSDNSLDLYLQATPPPAGSKQRCNWLPTPATGGYIAFLRMYWPDQTILNGDWIPPGIVRGN